MARRRIAARKKTEIIVKDEDIYSEQIALEICQIIANTELTINDICKLREDYPKPSTIVGWRITHQDFANMYDNAKKTQTELWIDQIRREAEDESNDFYESKDGLKPNPVAVARSKLKIESMKWMATKILPRIYGDRITNDMTLHIKQEHALDELE